MLSTETKDSFQRNRFCSASNANSKGAAFDAGLGLSQGLSGPIKSPNFEN